MQVEILTELLCEVISQTRKKAWFQLDIRHTIDSWAACKKRIHDTEITEYVNKFKNIKKNTKNIE